MKAEEKISKLIDAIEDKAMAFSPIYLKQMPPESQMMRYDVKFIFPSTLIPALIENTSQVYKILEIKGKRILRYQSHYFDTPGFDMYTDHHNGKGERFKVRIRKYVDTEDEFLEIKKKTNKGLMMKHRVEVEGPDKLGQNANALVKEHTPYDPDMLSKSLQTSFCRITLVNTKSDERITLDFNLNLSTGEKKINLPGLGIAEIKKSDRHKVSLFENTLNEHSVKPTNFSKYCIGLTLLNDAIKYNNFKPKVLVLKNFENEFSIDPNL